MEKQKFNKFPSYRIYKPRKDGSGCATKLEFRAAEIDKGGKKLRTHLLFITMAQQAGVDANGNATFGWDNEGKMTNIKLGDNDVAEILAVLWGRKGFVGLEASKGLFHKNSKGNSSLQFAYIGEKTENGKTMPAHYKIRTSSQRDGKLVAIQHLMTIAEGVIFQTLLEDSIKRKYW